jgi:hypothetical protein
MVGLRSLLRRGHSPQTESAAVAARSADKRGHCKHSNRRATRLESFANARSTIIFPEFPQGAPDRRGAHTQLLGRITKTRRLAVCLEQVRPLQPHHHCAGSRSERRPRPGASRRSEDRPWLAKRRSHRRTVGEETPTREAISVVGKPSRASRTIRLRHTTR